MMTGDVNAAIRGARAAGATQVVVKDSHGNSKNLLIDQLEPGTELVSGHGTGLEGMMQGLMEGFDAALLVGYHAMAGTQGGIMEHTITGGIHRLWLNGVETGEIGLSSYLAGTLGVPVSFCSSDDKGCAEAALVNPGLETVVTKGGIGRYMGQVRHPSEVWAEIEAGVTKALASPKERVTISGAVQVRIEFNRQEEANMVAKLVGASQVDGYSVVINCPDYVTAHRTVWNMVGMSDPGRRSGD
jgi:D-amino peptidase